MTTTKDKAADKRLQREYGITLKEYNAILAHQGGKCAICKRPTTDFRTRLAVDHSHNEPSLVRGLVCWRCNHKIAVCLDDPFIMANAAEYLSHPPAISVIGVRITAPGRVGTKKRAKLLKKLSQNGDNLKKWIVI